ncbi:MAG: hypothetical protein QXK89_09625 [Candidatus Bathyarchaeia archaeon]
MGGISRIRSFLVVLAIIALATLLIPTLYVNMPYGAWEYETFYSFRMEHESLPFEILSVSWTNPTPGIIIFEITIRTRERIWEIIPIPMLQNVSSYGNYPHETYPQYGHDLPAGEEKTLGVIVKYAPEDAEVSSVEYSIVFLRAVTIYRTVHRSIISLLPPLPYALLLGGLPILIALIVAELPIFQKIVYGINMEFLSEIVIGTCAITLLISAGLPWISEYAKIVKESSAHTSLSKYFSFKIQDSYPFPSNQIISITVTAYALALFIIFVPIEIEIGRLHIRRKIILFRSSSSGLLSIISAVSWIYGVEITRIEPVHPAYITYEANIGPFLAIILGSILIFLSYLSAKVFSREDQK